MSTFYYQVLPLVKIPINKNPFFTYQAKEKISFGSLVEIGFGRKKVRGIVLEKTSRPNFRTRKIEKIKTENLINKKQLALAKKVSEYYLASLGLVIKLFVFNLTKKDTSLKNKFSKTKNSKTITLTSDQKKALKKIQKNKRNLIFGPASSGKTEVAMNLIEKELTLKRQALVILPEIFLSYQEIFRYQQRFHNKKVALLHSKLKPSEISTIWKKTQKGEIDIIISTKIGCFLPFRSLGVIIVDEEQDISHKNWDQSPKYHTEKVASWLASLSNAELVFLSATPSIKNYWKAKEDLDDWNLIKLPSLKTAEIKIKKPAIKIIDLWEKKYSKKGQILFSQELIEEFRRNLKANKIAFVLVPYYGKSQAVFCENCKNQLKCPNCQNSLIHSGDNYQCLHCNYKISVLTGCPKCKSYKLRNVGFGTESAASEIKTLFPQAKIKTVGRSLFENQQSFEKLFDKIKNNQLDFLIGTQVIAKGFDFSNVNLVAVLNAQRWTGKSDFKFDERWLGGFFQVAGRLNRPLSNQKGVFCLQTFRPNLEILDFLKKWDWSDFAKKELPNRKALKYPPFNNLLKISLKNIEKNKVEKNTQKVYNQLRTSKKIKNLEISEPYYGFVKKKGIFWFKHLLIKITGNKTEIKLREKLRKLPPDWSFDFDPENIF